MIPLLLALAAGRPAEALPPLERALAIGIADPGKLAELRLALARALCVRPQALLLDEPLAALDVHARREVREFLSRYLRELGLPTLVVTHDAADAQQLGSRIAVLEAGRITQRGTWAELAQNPGSKFVEEFIATAGR